MTLQCVEEAKAQAKALRRELADQGTPIRQSEALERIARQNGARDWNTLHARLSSPALRGLRPNMPVRGRYLGQDFTGRIVSVAKAGQYRRVKIRLDHPVDTVKFDSFSNWRRTILGLIAEDGRSPEKTSDGMPQLIVEKLPPRSP